MVELAKLKCKRGMRFHAHPKTYTASPRDAAVYETLKVSMTPLPKSQ